MPSSEPEGKRESLEWMKWGRPNTVIDVGPGDGTYERLFRPIGPARQHWTAIEVWEPYIARFGLEERYDRVLVADAAEVDLAELDPYNEMAIFGDVVEHLEKDRAIDMVLRLPWRSAILSLPIIDYPQGECEGNPFEAHLHTWDAEQVRDSFPVRAEHVGSRIGVFLLGR